MYSATGPERPLKMGEVLETARAVSGSEARFTWVGEMTLLAQNVEPFGELPLWVPREAEAFCCFSNRKAVSAGLTFRPLAENPRDTLAWDKTRTPGGPRPNGLKPEREAEMLAAWHAAHDQ